MKNRRKIFGIFAVVAVMAAVIVCAPTPAMGQTELNEQAESPVNSAEIAEMVREVLGKNVYAEVEGGISHELWESLIPAGTDYVNAILLARATADDAEATSISQTAYQIFESEVNAKLSESQRNSRAAWRAMFAEENLQIREHVTSPAAVSAAHQQMRSSGSSVATFDYEEPPKSNK